MGCEGLLAEPWAIKSETMVQEFQHSAIQRVGGTIRRDAGTTGPRICGLTSTDSGRRAACELVGQERG